MTERSTINGHRRPSTAAATARRRQRSTERLAGNLGPRVHLLTDDWLSALAGVVVAEYCRRGLPLLDLLDPADPAASIAVDALVVDLLGERGQQA